MSYHNSMSEDIKEALVITGFLAGLALLLIGVPIALVFAGEYLFSTLGMWVGGALGLFTNIFIITFLRIRCD